MVKLLRLAVTKPHFDDEPVERIRAQIEASIRGSARDPDEIAGDALRNAAFPGHPYGRPVEGTSDSVAAITTGDLKAFFGHTFARNNLKVAVVGAIDPASLGRLLDDVFGDLPIKSELAEVSGDDAAVRPASRHPDGTEADRHPLRRQGLEAERPGLCRCLDCHLHPWRRRLLLAPLQRGAREARSDFHGVPFGRPPTITLDTVSGGTLRRVTTRPTRWSA